MTSKYNPCEESESIVIVFDLDCRCTMLRRCWLIWKRILKISGLSLHVVVFLSMDNLDALMQYKLTIKAFIHCRALSILAKFSGVILYIWALWSSYSHRSGGHAIQCWACKFIEWTACVSTHSLCCRCVVSGAGKVALYAVEKLITFGAIPVTISGNFVWLLG